MAINPDHPDKQKSIDAAKKCAEDFGGMWCSCYVTSMGTWCVATYREATRETVEPLMLTQVFDGGPINMSHPDYLDDLLSRVREMVARLGEDDKGRPNAMLLAEKFDQHDPETIERFNNGDYDLYTIVEFRALTHL
jgi:uncharacterized protein with GYD domain